MDINKLSLIKTIENKNWNVKLKGETEISKFIKIDFKEHIKPSEGDVTFLKEMKIVFDSIKYRWNYQDFYIIVSGYFKYRPSDGKPSYYSWKSGKPFKYSSNKIIFYTANDVYEDDSGFTGELESIILYIIPFSIKAGDDDKHNDCFFNCLKNVFMILKIHLI